MNVDELPSHSPEESPYDKLTTMKKQLTSDEFRRMQLVELELLVEFDRVCRKHDIPYIMIGGTLLGAIRHKGYIPWDDDADVALLREDYEKFKNVANELDPSIAFFQDHYNDPEYLWGYAKIRRTGSEYVRDGQEHLKHKTGICIDILPFDDTPRNIVGQMLMDFYCFCLRKTMWAHVACEHEKGFWKIWFGMLTKIPIDFVFWCVEHMAARSRNETPNLVRQLTLQSQGKYWRKHPLRQRYGIPKKWFLERNEYVFEGHRFFGPADAHGFLEFVFGSDYMELPPTNKREQHASCSSITFPATVPRSNGGARMP